MITSALRQVPRAVLNSYIRVARLPLTAMERISNPQDAQTWPPTLAFESFEASVETIAGSLLRDATLTENGRLRQAKVAKLREAGELKTVSKLASAQARETQQKRKAEIADQRSQSLRAAAERKTEIEQQAAAEKQRVDATTAKKRAAARAQKAAQEKVIERRERATRSATLEAESDAIDLTEKALEADETADVIDATLEGSKQARKTG